MSQTKPPVPPYVGIILGVISVSFAAIFIRLCQAPPLAVAFYRMTLAALVLLPLMSLRGWSHLRSASRATLMRAMLAGVFLGLHMGVWVTSLFFTSVASSIILVSTQSVFAVLISHFGIKERVSRGIMLAVIIAVIGSAIITGGDLRIGRDTMVGDILALTGGLMAALYMIAGRKIRQELPLLPYIFVAYSTAALLLGIGCLVFRTQMWGYPGQTYLWLILLALIPTHLGHTMFNWALKYLPAYVIGISLLGEPIGSTILAVLVFSEIPPAMTFAGGTLVLAGLYMLAREERGARKKADPGSWMLEAGK